MTGVCGVNHVTLVCSDLDRSISFYCNTLCAVLRAKWATGAYLELGTLWLCLERGTPEARNDDTHLALGCRAQDFPDLARRIRTTARLWKENRSEGASLYFLDPDAHRLELHVGSLQSRLDSYRDRDDIEIFAKPVSE